LETNTIIELDELPTKMSEDVEIKYLFEQKKRKEIDNLLKRGMRVKTTPSKNSLMKQSYSTASHIHEGKITPIHRRLITPAKGSITKGANFSPILKSKNRSLTKASLGKISSGKKSPFITNPFYEHAGVVKPYYDKRSFNSEFLSVYELMDVYQYCPDPKMARILRPIPEFLKKFRNEIKNLKPKKISKNQLQKKFEENKGKENDDFRGGVDFSFKKKRAGNEVFEDEEEGSEFEEEGKGIDIECIKDGINKGLMNWGQLVFDRACLTHLERNVHLLD